MSNEITNTNNQTFSLAPRNLDEAMRYADLLSKSSFVPKDYKGKAGDILVAVQMGAETGLPPIQALQNIAVINGRPSIWGDAALAICQSHPKYEGIEESIEEDKAGLPMAVCVVRRKGEEEYRVTFSVDDAKKAGLWGRQGPWSSYPKRMLQMRARGFALRDKFSDALKGMITREEAEDMPREMKTVKEEPQYASKADKIAASLEAPIVEREEPEAVMPLQTRIEKIVSAIYDLGGDDGDICSIADVGSIHELDEDNHSHIEALTTLGKRLKGMR